MLLRIIIPTYNGERTIAKTVGHLLSQTRDVSGVSVLIIPNGCTDQTCEEVGKFKKEKMVEIYTLSESSKILAMNLGASLSRNYRYMVFMDDDCRVNKPDILAGIEALETNPNLHALALQPKGTINSPTPWGRVRQRIFRQATEYRFLATPKKYMVGRFMMFRSDSWVDIPESVIHDDAWLTRIHFPNLKILHRNFVCYTPSSSIKESGG